MGIDISDFIKTKAHELGFQKVGIAPAERMKMEGDSLQAWLEAGYHGQMKWMETRAKERKDINQYFPEVKSVISVAINYFYGTPNGELKVSNYAWGDDYHPVLKSGLRELLGNIQRVEPEIKGIICVDTSPVMEKAWARRSGVGWIGKNTNLLTRDYGSWLFLGELLLDCELEYDSPFQDDLCGSCTACLDACPTGAIVQKYVLDANRCISYLTVEYRGNLPEQMAGQLHGWIYGCDVCQEVCPWNIKFGKQSTEPAFAPRSSIMDRSAGEWRGMTREDYQRTFRNSAVKRAKFESLKRNMESNFTGK